VSTPDTGLASQLQTLSNPVRLRILQSVLDSPASSAQLCSALGLAPALVRSHLRALAAARLVNREVAAGKELYCADNDAVTILSASLVRHLTPPVNGSPDYTPLLPADPDALSMRAPTPPGACLSCSNAPFVTRVAGDLDRVLDEARAYYSRLQQMSSQVLTAQEAERKRIARELHDDTAQALTSILVRLKLLEQSTADSEIHQNVTELRELTGLALNSVRRLAMDLRPTALDDLGLIPALHSYAEKVFQAWPIAVRVSAPSIKRRLPPDLELVLYRIVQEALSNVGKHSGATEAEVTLERRRNVVTASISDNGRGFDPEREMIRDDTGLGLFGMKERLALVGGTLEILSRPREGTRIVARVIVPGKRRKGTRPHGF
jgi:signal transduction histidine kinase